MSDDAIPGPPRAGRLGAAGAGIALLLLVAYHANGDFLPGNDAKPNVYLPVSLLTEGNLTFTPREMPFMFFWTLAGSGAAGEIRINRWDDPLPGGRAGDLLAAGRLAVEGNAYYVVPSRRPGEFAGAFGIGAGLTALPLFAATKLLRGEAFADPWWLWYGGKLAASLCVAGSAWLLFLAAARFAPPSAAALVALAYGLGTCVFSMSSQQLYQHAPAELFLAAAAYFWTRGGGKCTDVALAGAACGAALLCRPTCGLVAAALAAGAAFRGRGALAAFAAGVAPFALALAIANAATLGSPFAFGQSRAGEALALAKTGSSGVWQTPLLEGLAGILASPSRGLFVFSPFLLLALAGGLLAWREARLVPLRPFTAAVAAIWIVEAKHFDWWSGWSYGYRHIVDTTVLLALLLAPVLPLWLRSRRRAALFALLLAWSVGVQFLGAFTYDLWGWNNRLVGETRQNVDLPAHRGRLWSLSDSQIPYYLAHAPASRRFKRELMRAWLENPAL